MTVSIMRNKKKTDIFKNSAAILLALLVWQIAASAFDSKIIFATPVASVVRLYELVCDKRIFSLLLFTFIRISTGFIAALFCGCLLASAAAKYEMAEILLFPYMLTIKSVPVASFVIIALFLFSSAGLSAFVAFLIVLPVIYTNVLSGIKNTDSKMLSVVKVYKIGLLRKIIYVYLPSVKPYLISGCRIAIGLAWKSGIAAEIIGVPSGSMGEALYYSKIHLEADTLFAVTVIIIAASVVCEKAFALLLKKFFSIIEGI